MDAQDALRYPLGRAVRPPVLTPAERAAAIEQIREAPARLRAAVAGLDDAQLDTRYRDGGWTVRQVVHHVPDSHTNAVIRFKFALTEDNPTIMPYDEDAWSRLADVRATPIETSLALLDALHARWVHLLEGMRPEEFQRTLMHPENGPMTLDAMTGLYAWHGRHHVAHITTLRERMGW